KRSVSAAASQFSNALYVHSPSPLTLVGSPNHSLIFAIVAPAARAADHPNHRFGTALIVIFERIARGMSVGVPASQWIASTSLSKPKTKVSVPPPFTMM